ncbi:hypothetical protein PHET_10450 [Paragonimus heterotremus]|uniref:Uncharacterized protein n=1 Tax=Paragonimus heterotremus TaxID=100268 RepID=A0A8J4WE76_9TREM|nr:hypothetical protein PHET_10450 [Paragonimus heterotremus]
MLYTLVLCILVVIEGKLTQKEREKTLCFHNTLLQEFSNCMSLAGRKVNILVSNRQNTFEGYILQLYGTLPNVTEHYSDNINWDLPTYFYRLSSTNKVTQMGCDYAYTNRTVVPPIFILCFFNCPYHDFYGRPARGKVSCLYRDPSLSFSKCNVDTPRNNSPGSIRLPSNMFHLFCLILAIIGIWE